MNSLSRRLAAISLLVFACALRAADRPNILWVVSEDNVFTTVGAYGDPLARTPNVDRLAAGGITFDRAYSTSAVCAPTRSSIITGRYASSLGTQHMRSQRALPADVKFFPEFLRAAGYFTTNNAKTDYNTSSSWAAAWNENNKNAHWRHRAKDQPFFAIFNFEQSHESHLHKREPSATDPAKVRVPAYLPDTPAVRADIAQYYDCVSRADAALGQILKQLEADGLAEDTIVFYYGDHGGAVSRSKRFLYENGTHPPLVVHFPKKYQHLAPAAAGSHSPELVNWIDLAPTVLSLAGVALPAQFQGRAFAGAARSAAPEYTFMFRDRMDERYDLARAVTDGRYRYIRNYYPSQPWGQHLDFLWKQPSMSEWAKLAADGKLNAAQRAFFEPKPAEELFDCASDPDNVKNLAADTAARPHLLRLRAALRAHLLRSRDTGFMPEPLMIAWAGEGSPAAVAADEKRYPLARILDQLDALQLTAQPAAGAVDQALRAPEAVLRYWGAVAALRAAALPEPMDALLKDEHLVVRLAAAEAVLGRRNDPAAWEVIRLGLAEAKDPTERLFAVNVAARIKGGPAPVLKPALEAIMAAPAPKGGGENYTARAVEDLLAKFK
ncbi:MAG: sulfatase [Verrucomicrobia bacterium]|nr:sulfatase [Verrucomicrobiota bacterium]